MNSKLKKVAIIMGSNSDWPVMKHAADTLDFFGIVYEARVVSAHRTPDLMFDFAESSNSNGISLIIAGAGGCGASSRNGCLKIKTPCAWSSNSNKILKWS